MTYWSSRRISPLYCTVVRVAVPEFRDKYNLPRNMNATDGESVTVRCDAYAEPPANITWMQNGHPLDRQFDCPAHRALYLSTYVLRFEEINWLIDWLIVILRLSVVLSEQSWPKVFFQQNYGGWMSPVSPLPFPAISLFSSFYLFSWLLNPPLNSYQWL